MKKYDVAIIGATGMVGQRFCLLLAEHPWFNVKVLAASGRSAGKSFEEAVGDRWAMKAPIPEKFKKMTVIDASEIEKIGKLVSFVFCRISATVYIIAYLTDIYNRQLKLF